VVNTIGHEAGCYFISMPTNIQAQQWKDILDLLNQPQTSVENQFLGTLALAKYDTSWIWALTIFVRGLPACSYVSWASRESY
jgi:hypothetical protein